MQNSGWNELLRLIPASQHNNLVLTTSSGIEIALQSLVRLEKEFVVVRGRQTGTTDGGGFFFVPYDQVDFLGFQNPIPETEVRAMFGELVTETTASEALPPETRPTVQKESPTPTPAEPAAAPVAAPPTPRPNVPQPAPARPAGATNKAALLERLRARRSDGNPAT
jgi:hypothetical protein